MNHVWKVDAGSKVKLKDFDPGDTDKYTDHVSADLELQALSDELSELQELLSAAQTMLHGILFLEIINGIATWQWHIR